MTWDELALSDPVRFQTDKASSWRGSPEHGYLEAYERHLSHRAIRSVCEIGVASGGSLRLWEQLFQEAQVVGVDIVDACRTLAGGRIQIEIADAGDPAQLVGIVARHGPFDLVIDDGSHEERDVFAALGVLFDAVTPGGIYVIEDLVCEWFPDRTLRTRDEYWAMRWRWPEFCGRLVDWRLTRDDVAALTVERCQLTRGTSRGQCVVLLEKA
jgi:cephalosporin hydroxylase